MEIVLSQFVKSLAESGLMNDDEIQAFIDSLQQLTASMKGWYDIEDAMAGFPTRVSEAIMHTMETAHKFFPEVSSPLLVIIAG